MLRGSARSTLSRQSGATLVIELQAAEVVFRSPPTVTGWCLPGHGRVTGPRDESEVGWGKVTLRLPDLRPPWVALVRSERSVSAAEWSGDR